MKNKMVNLKQQSGVVLFVALVAIVVMSIAAVALIRSVDTNTSIAANLSFQQSAQVSAERGVESAIAWLEPQANTNPDTLDNTASGTNGYYATYGNLDASLDLDDRAVLKDDATWNTYSALATGTGISGGKEADTRNQINYIIERMCTAKLPPGNPTDYSQKCLLGASKEGGGGKGVKTSEQAGAKISGSQSVIYRITVRVAGPKNTRSYSQMYVY